MTLLALLYYHYKEYSLESAINKVQNDIGKLNIKILNGDKSAGRLAFEYLEEKDRLERMKEK
jgi:hypothetical protein